MLVLNHCETLSETWQWSNCFALKMDTQYLQFCFIGPTSNSTRFELSPHHTLPTSLFFYMHWCWEWTCIDTSYSHTTLKVILLQRIFKVSQHQLILRLNTEKYRYNREKSWAILCFLFYVICFTNSKWVLIYVSLLLENAALVFCCEASEIICGLRDFTQISMCMWVSRQRVNISSVFSVFFHSSCRFISVNTNMLVCRHASSTSRLVACEQQQPLDAAGVWQHNIMCATLHNIPSLLTVVTLGKDTHRWSHRQLGNFWLWRKNKNGKRWTFHYSVIWQTDDD